MINLILIAIVGVNIAPFIFFKLDIWSAQAAWVYIFTLILLGASFWARREDCFIKNLPLGLFFIWAGINTLFFFNMSMSSGVDFKYLLFGFLNILCAVILYQVFFIYLNRENLFKVIVGLRWVLVITIIMCGLQYLGLGQFFQMLFNDGFRNNPVVGFIGQPTHLAGYLGMLTPLLLYRNKREDYLALFLLCIILLFLTGTTKGDVAISGIVVALCSTFYWLWHANRKILLFLIPVMILGSAIYWFSLSGTGKFLLFNNNGRLTIWAEYLNLFKQMPITGSGLGFVELVSVKTTHPSAKHLHMEFFQLALELGIIGFALAIWMIKDFFEAKIDLTEALILKTIFLGFIVSCCFNWTAHLWLPSSVAVFTYAGLFALKKEVYYADGN